MAIPIPSPAGTKMETDSEHLRADSGSENSIPGGKDLIVSMASAQTGGWISTLKLQSQRNVAAGFRPVTNRTRPS
jgi:hypothetical protein